WQARAAVASPGSPFGEAEQLLPPALENFVELDEILPAHRQHWLRLAEWTRAEFARCAADMRARKAAGKVREGHGDLHLGNLVLIERTVTLFDCIEFADYLRWIDVANDIAFTYVDLLAQQQAGLAGWLLNEWLSANGDYQAMRVFRFYAVYRALVLAKVKAIHARQAQRDCSEADSYRLLAERLIAPPPPRLIITHGVAGCGKSRATRNLLLNDSPPMCIRLRSDVERKRLFGLSAGATTRSAIDGGIYAGEASERTYEELYQIAGDLLRAGWSVIVDAAFLERRRRDAFRALAGAAAAEFAIVAPQATAGQLRTRIQRRLARGRDASEATLAVLERQFERIEHLSDEERALRLPVDRRLLSFPNVQND
ncbi:MAG TPA: AAA family ATPase, partial [Accumulibacter sp.]|nr:AAA family ATPase [Accumulibacter sp.]